MSRKDGLLTSVNWNERGDLNIHNDLLLLLRRLVIPETLRQNVITYLHDTHQSITKTLENSGSSVWWPGLSRDIQKMVQDCDMWYNLQKEKIERMRGTPYPNRPWGKVAADSSVHKGHNYPPVVDYYSRDVEICLVSRSVNTAETNLRMKKVFILQSLQFASLWGFEHVTSSPLYAQSNGEVEHAVQTMKANLDKCDDEYLAFLTHRDTPLPKGYPPAWVAN